MFLTRLVEKVEAGSERRATNRSMVDGVACLVIHKFLSWGYFAVTRFEACMDTCLLVLLHLRVDSGACLLM